MNLQELTQEALQLIESEGPQVVGALLGMLVPKLPIDALVTLVSDVEEMFQSRNEADAMKQAVGASDAAVDAEEQALVTEGLLK